MGQGISTTVLPAATPTDVTVESMGCRTVALTLWNAGANAIGTITVKKSAKGTDYVSDGALTAALASGLASGASILIECTDVAWATMRFTCTSASGSSLRVEIGRRV